MVRQMDLRPRKIGRGIWIGLTWFRKDSGRSEPKLNDLLHLAPVVLCVQRNAVRDESQPYSVQHPTPGADPIPLSTGGGKPSGRA